MYNRKLESLYKKFILNKLAIVIKLILAWNIEKKFGLNKY